jgi:hypothetical protein
MKFFIFLSACISLLIFAFYTPLKPDLTKLRGEYCIYSREDITDPLVSRKINYGIGYIYYCDSNDAAKLRKSFTSVDGESIIVKNTTPDTILRTLALQETYQSNDGIYKTIYAKNSRLGSVQIAVRAADIAVGWPVVLGSY